MKISTEDILTKVSELAASISGYYSNIIKTDKLNIVVPMAGGVPFAVDLLREILSPSPEKILISYVFTDGNHWNFTGSKPKKGCPVLIVEDIYDSGDTLSKLIQYLIDNYSPTDLKVVVMLNKKIKKNVEVDIDWCGFDIEDTWVYGYGMDDAKGTRRQLSFISDEK
tara:strand:+ start:544 stop:1044 length:501 start_codon:yes stop_codon:yes gene_type:complete